MLFAFSATLHAQNGVAVKGKVTDTAAEPLIGASVIVKGQPSLGTVTDIDGNFHLTVPSEQSVLVISYVGMTTKEINRHYREAICVWNAYISSTQSGVLPNALMQGAPVIVRDRGVAEEVIQDKVEGCYISIPHNNDEILAAYQYIQMNLSEFVSNARKCFLKNYMYSAFLDKAKEVYEVK